MHSKRLRDIEFPVYKLGAFDRIYNSPVGHVMIDTHRATYTLDDSNDKEPSYAKRRIQLKRKGFDLYFLNKMISTFSSIIQYPSGAYFIDASGYVFKYKKGNKYFELKCYKITKKVFDPERAGSILFAEGLPYPIFYMGKVNPNYKYMGILHVEGGGLLHSIVREPFKPTRRMI